jgi:hypothetical protein
MNKGEWKLFILSDKTNILAQLELVSWLRISVFTVNSTVKKLEEVTSAWTFLQAVEITETFATGGTGICTFCMV